MDTKQPKQSLEKQYNPSKKWVEDMLSQTFTKDSPTNKKKE